MPAEATPTDSPDEYSNYFRVRMFDVEPASEHDSGIEKRVCREHLVLAKRAQPDYHGRWVFEVAVIHWPHPHKPIPEWRVFRSWKNEPSSESVERAKRAALRESRFFRHCNYCKRLCNSGRMHDRDVCQGCAERELGVMH